MSALVVSAFPGTGKTKFAEDHPEWKIVDLQSSNFSWITDDQGNKERNPQFPKNYIQKVKELLQDKQTQLILLSSHQPVRDQLWRNQIQFLMIYPDVSLKEEYLSRFKERGDTKEFIDNIEKHWQEWIQRMDLEFLLDVCKKVKITRNKTYLNDIIKKR